MKTRLINFNISLLLEFLICLAGIGIGIFGIWYDSAIVLCIILISFSAVCALTLLFTQYLYVRFDEDGVYVVYLLATLGARYSDLSEVKIDMLFSSPLPIFDYYSLNLSLIKGLRLPFIDACILKTRKNKYALLAHGVRIQNESNVPFDTCAEVPAEIRKTEHRVRDAHMKAVKLLDGAAPKFGYEVYGLYLSARPSGSYRYVAKDGDTITPLLSVKKSFGKYKTKILFETTEKN